MRDTGPVDFLGKPLVIGCTVVYPTREGSDMRLSSGVLMDFACGAPGTGWKLIVETRTVSGKRRKGTGIPATRTVRVS